MQTGNMESNGAITFETEIDNGNSGASATIDWAEGNKQMITLTDDCTISFSDPQGACNLVFKVVQEGSGGSRTITWPGTIKWVGATEPTLSTAVDSIDIITFYFDGTTYFGASLLDFQVEA